MTQVRKILKDYGIRPSKRLGQSFLEDRNIIHKITRLSDVCGEDVVVEIGAGLGIMTELLAAKARKVVAIDVDPRMTDILRERLSGLSNVEIIERDILSYDFLSALGDGSAAKLKVVGNVPYNISSQILFHLIDFRRIISSIVLLLQKEVVDRITAAPGTKDYGIPSVIVSMYFVATREMNVPASCFYPPPRVVSSLLKMVMRQRPVLDLEDEYFFSRIVKAAFARRRKTLLNNLRSAGFLCSSEKELNLFLSELDIDGNRRGETLSAEEFGRLSNALFRAK